MFEQEPSGEVYTEASAIQRVAPDSVERKVGPNDNKHDAVSAFIDSLERLGNRGIERVGSLADEKNVIAEFGQDKGEVLVGLWSAMMMERERNFSRIILEARKTFDGRDVSDPGVMAEMSAFLIERMLPFYEEMVDKVRRARSLKTIFASDEDRKQLAQYLDQWLNHMRDNFEAVGRGSNNGKPPIAKDELLGIGH